MSFHKLLNKTCSVKSGLSTSQNDYGEPIPSTETKYQNVPCRVKQKRIGDREFLQEGVEFASVQYVVYIEKEYSIDRNDIIAVDGKSLRVVLNSMDSSNHHYELDCKEITG